MQLPRWLLGLILLLIPLAFLVNLGVQPFIDDEGNRSLVALEMLWSGNYITPTLHGSYYYNKPPLWNWILALSFQLHGGASEWAARFPAVLSLFGFAATVFYYCKRHLRFEKALLVALMLLCCGRIIFWESLLGLIDIAFSWSIFTLIMVIYHKGEKQHWGRMFLFSYLLMTVGFMFKGLPAIVFQGLTLITYLLFKGEWKRLFSLAHIASGLLAVGLIAMYYFSYHQYNSLDNVFQALFVESGKRTAVAYGLADTIKHIINFPLELFYHFLPWTLLLLFFTKRIYRQRLGEKTFVRFCIYAFLVNLSIYWLSPNFYPRYILMLLPLSFVILVQMIPDSQETKDLVSRGLRGFFGLFILVLAAGAIVALFVKNTQFIPALTLKTTGCFLAIIALFVLYWKRPAYQYFILVAAFLVFRLGFDFLALPPRAEDSSGQRLKDSAIAFSKRWQDQDIKVFSETHMEPANSYYLEQAMGKIIPRKEEGFNQEDFYIFNPQQYHTNLFESLIDSFVVRHSYHPVYYVGQLKTVDAEAIKKATIGERPGF